MKIVSLNVGKPKPLTADEGSVLSGIWKTSVGTGPIRLTETGFHGDGQADLVYHGGPDKAICVYCYEHYPYWEQVMDKPLPHGAFGENLTVQGLTEREIRIGDIFECGPVRVQVSQPRQPCYKLGKRHDRTELPLLVLQTGYTGFYFRVLAAGMFDPTQPLQLVHPDPGGMTLEFANRIFYHDKSNMTGIRRILAVEALSEAWRTSLEKRLDSTHSS
ncbi:MOSC domain-containing protein [Paenibacillus koleovorans]|uniref:MOSC domain-containing protein n=1 Tax=Paenibacillus koleovorans TaxID=121608 RepID=UPI000FD9CD7E|nr:MOSC domain-containing protein [Paenibacillus koleovorans]